MSNISVIILTLNEEKNIAGCLDSVQWADEVIVVDSGSTDDTIRLAKELHATILHLPWEGYGTTKNKALEHTSGEWILWLDADERVTSGLAREIRQVAADPDNPKVAYAFPRKAYFLGRWIKHAGWYPSPVVRFFRKGKGKFSNNKVHEKLITYGAIGRLSNNLIHYTYPDLRIYFSKFNRYTTLAAEEMAEAGRRFRLRHLILRPAFTFFLMYFLRRGFLDGIQGFILCVTSTLYVFVKYAKLWEIENSQSE